MSKPSRRPNREKIKAQNKQYKKAQRELLQDEKLRGLQKPAHIGFQKIKLLIFEKRYIPNFI